MFVGKPPGNYDRLLDVSRAVTGSLFFVPPATFLDDANSDDVATLDDVATATTPSSSAAPDASESTPRQASPDGSLHIGSLKKEAGHE
jgi:putative iron-dependent peroxidase